MNQADFWKLFEEVNQACPSRDHESMEAQMIERLIHHNVDDILTEMLNSLQAIRNRRML